MPGSQESQGSQDRSAVGKIIENGNVEEICNVILKQTQEMLQEEEVTGQRKEYITKRVEELTKNFVDNSDLERASTMLRYLKEVGHYEENTEKLLDHIKLNYPGASVLDIGTGAGALLRSLEKQAIEAYGVDLSPGFAIKNDKILLGLIDVPGIDNLVEDLRQQEFTPNLFTTKLTLDRVANPVGLLGNIFSLKERYPNSNFMILTLLPIKPIDDDKSADNKIIYSHQHVTLGGGRETRFNIDRERKYLMNHLAIFANERFGVEMFEMPNCEVKSAGDDNVYTLYGFSSDRNVEPKKVKDSMGELFKMACENDNVEIVNRVYELSKILPRYDLPDVEKIAPKVKKYLTVVDEKSLVKEDEEIIALKEIYKENGNSTIAALLTMNSDLSQESIEKAIKLGRDYSDASEIIKKSLSPSAQTSILGRRLRSNSEYSTGSSKKVSQNDGSSSPGRT